MSWLTRSLNASPVAVSPGGGNYAFPVGAKLSDGRVRLWYGPSYLGQKSRVAASPFTSWSDASDYHSGLYNLVGEEAGISNVRRGNPNGAHPNRLHAVLSQSQWYKDATYGDFVARACTNAEVNWPTAVGNKIVYKPYYTYSDDGGDTWSTPEAVPYTGANAAPMDVCELSNGDVICSWYGNGADASPPYTTTGDYPDTKVSRRDHTTGTWTVVGTIGTKAAMGAPVVEASHDVIHDGTIYGKLVCVFTVEDAYLSACWQTSSTDGGATWATPVFLNRGANRRNLCVAPDGDLIWAYFQPTLNNGVFRVSQDGGATWGAEQSIGASDGWNGNKWVTAIPAGAAGVSPNVVLAYGSGSSDVSGASYAVALTRGSDGLSTVGRSLAQPYAARNLVPRSLAQPYVVRNLVPRSLAQPYAVQTLTAGSSLSMPYEVLPVVGRSLVAPYSVYQYAARSLYGSYAVPQISTSFATDRRLGPPQVTYQTKRVVQVGATHVIGRSLGQSFITAPKVAQSLGQSYTVTAPIPGLSTLLMPYKVIETIGRSAAQTYYIRATLSRPLEASYTVKNLTTQSLIFSYLIHGLWTGNFGILIEPDHKYTIASQKENEIILFINPILHRGRYGNARSLPIHERQTNSLN